MNFRQWQHVRWSGAQHKCSPDEISVKKVSEGEKPVCDKSQKDK